MTALPPHSRTAASTMTHAEFSPEDPFPYTRGPWQVSWDWNADENGFSVVAHADDFDRDWKNPIARVLYAAGGGITADEVAQARAAGEYEDEDAETDKADGRETRANARLIAAAPELYEALFALVNVTPHPLTPGGEEMPWFDAVDAARTVLLIAQGDIERDPGDGILR